MKINGHEVNGKKYSSRSSMNSLKSTPFHNSANSKNISSSDDVSHISQMDNLSKDIIRNFSRSKGHKNAQSEQLISKIILIIIFGPMIINLIVSIISAIFRSLTTL